MWRSVKMADERVNTDAKLASMVIDGGYNSFVEKNSRMMDYLREEIAELQTMIDKLQSTDIQAGYLPDDDNDIVKFLDEIVEEVDKNLFVLGNAIKGMSDSTKVTLNTAGFMRLSKDQAAIKTFPGGN
jgi:uncharacterized protein YydD (DUF2326 family)